MSSFVFQLTRRDDADGDMTFGDNLANFASNQEATAQNVKTRLRSYLGEWFLDTSFGTPWAQDVLIKPEQKQLVEADLKAIILQTIGVDEITRFDFSQSNRSVSIRVDVTTIYGTIEGIQLDL